MEQLKFFKFKDIVNIISDIYYQMSLPSILKAQLDEQARLLAERGMVLVGNEDEDTTCEDEDRANANGKYFLWCLF